jgi:hypothetical protein
MRESSDIDLVIRAEDLPKTFQIMEEEGFETTQKKYYNWIGHKQFIKNQKDLMFDRFVMGTREFHVEFHFNIVEKYIYLPPSFNDFRINNSDENKLVKENIHFLHPTEHFKAVLLHHMLKDNICDLKTIIDLAQVIIELNNQEIQLEHELFKLDLLKKLSNSFNVNIVKSMINDLIGTKFETNNLQIVKTRILTSKLLIYDYRKPVGSTFSPLGKVKHHYLNFIITSVFFITNKNKFLFLLRKIWTIINPHPYDYVGNKLNKKLNLLYFITRPFMLIFFSNYFNKTKSR